MLTDALHQELICLISSRMDPKDPIKKHYRSSTVFCRVCGTSPHLRIIWWPQRAVVKCGWVHSPFCTRIKELLWKRICHADIQPKWISTMRIYGFHCCADVVMNRLFNKIERNVRKLLGFSPFVCLGWEQEFQFSREQSSLFSWYIGAMSQAWWSYQTILVTNVARVSSQFCKVVVVILGI